jgi:hypothetical protein
MSERDAKTNRFTFLCSDAERQIITALAEQLNRSQGDAIRFVLRIAAQELHLNIYTQVAGDKVDLYNGRSEGVVEGRGYGE